MERSLVLSLCFVVQVLVALTESHRIVFPISVTLEEGDICTMHTGVQGRCMDIRHCDYTGMDFRVKPPVRCGFNGIFPVVCCPSVPSNNPELVTDTAPPNLTFQCGRNARNIFTLSFSYVDDKKVYAEIEDVNPVKFFNVTEKLENGTEVVHEVGVGGVGSEKAEKNAWPWMALIGKRDNKGFTWFCGGVLINDQWVLTALHCLLDNTAEVVRLGEHNYKDDNDGAAHEDFDVAETVLYPGYNHPEAYHDLALLRLAPRVTIKEFMSPVCLAWGSESDVDITNQNTTLTGYGDTEFGGIPTSYLQEVNVTVFPAAQCDRSYSSLPHYTRTWPRGIGQETLCAGDPVGGRDACQGDSGRPLVSQDSRGLFVLAGIVSRGYGCGNKGYPGLYANMRHPPYLVWIKKVAFTTH